MSGIDHADPVSSYRFDISTEVEETAEVPIISYKVGKACYPGASNANLR